MAGAALMFGLLRPSDKGLRCSERQEFNSFYCGLCKGLDHHHGAVTRGLLSYDGVFVALVVDALVLEAAAPSKCRCPILPVVHRRTVAPDSIAMTYAASVQMLLFDQWAADGGRSLVRRFSRPHAEAAHARLEALGVSLRALEDFDRLQSRIESEAVGPIRAAAPTAEALRLVFSRMATLPAANADAATLGELGAALGRAIYFVDALEDLDDDVRAGAFNPCILQGRRDEKRVRETARLLRGNVDGLAPLLEALPLVRHQRVLRDILGELRARAMRAAEGVSGAPESRMRALVVTMAVFLWAMLCAVPRAFAAAPKRDAGKHHDAGLHDAGLRDAGLHDAGLHDAGEDAGADASSDSPWGPLVLPEEDAGLPALPTERTDRKDRKEEEEKKRTDDAKSKDSDRGCPDCGRTFRDCAECCKAPSHCCDSCAGCCKPCSDCCQGCDNCGKSCGDCGNCCNSCGNCCK